MDERADRKIRKAIAHRLAPIRDGRWLLQRLGLTRLFTPADLPAGGKILRIYPRTVRPPLIDPDVVPAAEADHMREEDTVLGLVAGGEARAYPWWMLAMRHVANDVVAGRPAAVLLCARCSSGMAFDPVVNGARLTFEVRDIYNGTAAMRDLETGTLWSPFLGLAIDGELKGRTISLMPLWQMEWRAWRELHPRTMVVVGDPKLKQWRKASIQHTDLRGPFLKSAARSDERLPPSTLVLGVVTAGGQRAYRIDRLTSGDGVVNDEVGGFPVVVLAHPARGSFGAVAFSRVVDGRILTFEAGPDGLSDVETGSRWSLEGRASDGPLTGTQLPYVASHVAMWYVWAAHFPALDIAPSEPAAPGAQDRPARGPAKQGLGVE